MVGNSTLGNAATCRNRYATAPTRNSPTESRMVAIGRSMNGNEKFSAFLPSRPVEGAGRYDLGQRPIRRAELQGIGFRLRQHLATMLCDRFRESGAISDLEAPMVNARARPGELGFGGILAVVNHQGEIGFPVRHVAGNVLVVAPGLDLAESEHVLVEPGRLFEILHLDGDMGDPRLVALLLLLVAADADDLRHGAVGGAELKRALHPIGEDDTAIVGYLLHRRFAVLNFDADVVDAR